MWLATGRASSEAGQYRPGDRLLNPFPLVNMAALGGFLMPFALNGCSLILHHPFDPAVFMGQMQQERITFTIVPPAMLNQLAKSADTWNRFDFSALRRIGSGSAPLSPWMIDVFDNQYGKAIVNFYGSNEGISLFSTPESSKDPEVRASMFPRLGCAGMPWTGVAHELVRNRVVRVGTEEEITEPGEPGELLFAGPTVFDGYLGSGNENVFTSDGWFRTGDLVEICGEPPNYYRIVGRCKDIINRGGMKISPAEIDVLLEGHPAIAEAAVCAYPDENLGERVCACIVVATDNEQPSLADLNDYLLQQGLAKFKLPERLMVLPGLPRNALGKVQRNELQTMVSNDG
jgi:acyl-CoA synthetase (AMP-forming)/AMP-acid ligase II